MDPRDTSRGQLAGVGARVRESRRQFRLLMGDRSLCFVWYGREVNAVLVLVPNLPMLAIYCGNVRGLISGSLLWSLFED